MNKQAKLEQVNKIAVFEGKTVRRFWDDEREMWFFSVIDVVAILSQSKDPRNYWKVLKNRLKKEGSEVVTKCNQLKMIASDGKYYLTDAVNTEGMFRIIQSIPSPNAEPFKLWLAKVGYERIEETDDPELAINRALKTYLKKGHTPEWVNQRLKSIEIRKALTDEWEKQGIKAGHEFAILTDVITEAWSGLTTKQYKNLKNLKKENLRDNMTNLELVLNMLAETATTAISKKRNPKTFNDSKVVAKDGGKIAGHARKELEVQTGQNVVTKQNHLNLKKKKILLSKTSNKKS